MNLLLIGFAIWLLTRKKGNDPTKIGTQERNPDTITTPNPDETADYVTAVAEEENKAWTWYKRPAIFDEVFLLPAARDYWFQISELWQENRAAWTERHALERDIEEYKREGRGNADLEDELKTFVRIMEARAYQANFLANALRQHEARYKTLLLQKYSPAQVADFYQQRKNEILQGIWPDVETVVVPGVVPNNDTSPGDSALNIDGRF